MEVKKQFRVNSEREAWGAIAWIMITYKGEEMTDYTANVLARTFYTCSVFGHGKYSETLEPYSMLVYQHDVKDVLDASIKYIHPEDYRTMFITCLELFSTLENIDNEKIERMNYLRELLCVDEEEANDYIRVIKIKNKKDIR